MACKCECSTGSSQAGLQGCGLTIEHLFDAGMLAGIEDPHMYAFIEAGRPILFENSFWLSGAGGLGGAADAFAEQFAVVHLDAQPLHNAVQPDEGA